MADYTDINQLYINAVKQGNLAEVEQFILQGANIDTQDEDGMIALITAAKHGHKNIVNLILEHNVCDAERADKIYAAMWYAIYGGFTDIIEIFLQNGADINRVTQEGFSPLMIAIAGGRYEVVEFLLEHGADAGYANANGQSASMIAKASGHKDLEKLLEEYIDRQQNQSKIETDNEPMHSGRRIEL